MLAVSSSSPLCAAWRHVAASLAVAAAGLALAGPAAAQAVYRYTGLPFTLFSCGPSSSGNGTALCSVPAPTNPNTSYTATDAVTASLTLASPLPANMALTDVRTFSGFRLQMADGRHAVDDSMQVGMFAMVSTDASGNIATWRLIINTGGLDNGGIATQRWDFVSDSGTLRCCDPTVSGDLARNSNLPGTWTAPTAVTPTSAVTSLKTLVASPELGLTPGQVNALTDKLNNALASIQAGLYGQAINQLSAFINSVESSQKTGKMSASTATLLIDAARAAIRLMQG